MGYLSTLATACAPVAVGLVVTVLSGEFSAWAPILAKRMVHRAVRHLPEADRVATEAEWLAHVEQVPGNVGKVLHACGMWRAVAFSRGAAREFILRFQFLLILMLFLASGFSVGLNYIHGKSEGYIWFDGIPALAILSVAVPALVLFARRERRERRAKASTRGDPR